MRKIADGSSIIDILVYQETCKGRCVYLDYRTNPVGGALTYDALLPEAQEYLTCAGVCFGTPIDFYRDKGVDLYTQPLEIALCEYGREVSVPENAREHLPIPERLEAPLSSAKALSL